MRTIRLTGDYVGNHARQQQAADAGCTAVLDFHFNSDASASAHGGECFYQRDQPRSLELAQAITAAYTDRGLSLRKEPVKESLGTRAGFIDYYGCPTVLLEPMFVSTPSEATWLHEPGNIQALGSAIAAQLRPLLGNGAVIGISVGHKGKTSKPNDRGAECVCGDDEADHAEALAAAVEAGLLSA